MRGESRVRLHGAPGARDRSWELGEGAGTERRPSKKRQDLLSTPQPLKAWDEAAWWRKIDV